jgi:hypothetical protein
MTDPAPRRRFQFRLRTLMIGVALLAVPCAYVGWQVRIVRERQALIAAISHDVMYLDVQVAAAVGYYRSKKMTPATVPLLRQWLGDVAVEVIAIPARASPEFKERVKAAFPEATFVPKEIRQPDEPATKP